MQAYRFGHAAHHDPWMSGQDTIFAYSTHACDQNHISFQLIFDNVDQPILIVMVEI